MKNSEDLSVADHLNKVEYRGFKDYVPTKFALNFINFIKLVNDGRGEENPSPVVHYKILDSLCKPRVDSAIMAHRGIAKSSVTAEYLFLYLAVYGRINTTKPIDYAIYVSDSIENGIKKMRLRIERRIERSKFLKHYVPETRFTDIRWYFKNIDGREFVVTGHGAKTGVRGTVELNSRPQLAILDDLISDDDARSSTVIKSIEDTVYSAIEAALHPMNRKIIWSGTPFNANDPLYKAIESGAWDVSVYPICEKFPCSREEFRGSWEERFNYDYVLKQYTKLKKSGKVDSFFQEMMLRIISDDERLISESDLCWYKHANVKENRGMFNFYITSDFATSERESADYSVISVWALNNNGDWFWVDGVCKKMLMDETIDKLFFLSQKWHPQSAGIEVTGQQGGFIQWIYNEMMTRNIYFTLAKQLGSTREGIRPTKDKMSRFQANAVPLFKMNKIWFPAELKDTPEMVEMLEELRLATAKGFKSKHDDAIDTITMLHEMQTWRPSEVSSDEDPENPGSRRFLWDEQIKEDSGNSSYFV